MPFDSAMGHPHFALHLQFQVRSGVAVAACAWRRSTSDRMNLNLQVSMTVSPSSHSIALIHTFVNSMRSMTGQLALRGRDVRA